VQFDNKMRKALRDLCALGWILISPAILGILFKALWMAMSGITWVHITAMKKTF